MQPSQQHFAPCVKGVEWGLGTRGLRMLAAFWAGIPVEVTQEADAVPRCRSGAIGTPFQSPHRTLRNFGRILVPDHKGVEFPYFIL